VQQDRKPAAAPQANRPEPAQIVADLKKVAKWFGTNGGNKDKPSATAHVEAYASKAGPIHAVPQATQDGARADQVEPRA